MRAPQKLLLALALATASAPFLGCAAEDDDAIEQGDDEVNAGRSGVSCAETTDTAYSDGKATTIKVITIDGKKISKTTGHAFLKMQAAAKKAGVNLGLTSGFRTQAEQQRLYNCFRTKSCNSGNLAARPGYSNHQNGLAVDVTTSTWLAQNAPRFGFVRTVPSEPWHWEYRGKDPGGPCTKEGEETSPIKPAAPEPERRATASKDAGTTAAKDAGTAKDSGTSGSTSSRADAGSVASDAGRPATETKTETETETETTTTRDEVTDEEPETEPSTREEADEADDDDEAGESTKKREASASSGCAAAPREAPLSAAAALAVAAAFVSAVARRRRAARGDA